MSDASIRLSCPAKVNLALSVAAPDANGMHPIASWMVALSLADELVLTKRSGRDSLFAIHFDHDDEEITTRTNRDVDWPLRNDLAFRAHGLLEQHVGRPLPVLLNLKKRIPTGGGLGGGSSNAAATFVGLNRLFELNLPTSQLIEMSATLGSDIAFFIATAEGDSSALVTGLGDSIEPLLLKNVLHLVLILPDFGCPTGPVYGTFDRMNGIKQGEPNDTGPGVDVERVRHLAAKETLPQDGPFNALADAAMEVEPRLAEARQKVADALQLPVHITGSGSTMFVVAPSAITAKPLARKVTATTGFSSLAVRSV